MVRGGIFLFITKLGFYICPDEQFDDFTIYFKKFIYKFCDFEKEELYDMQIFLNELDSENFVEQHLKDSITQLKSELTDTKKYVILFRAFLALGNVNDAVSKIDNVANWLGYDIELINYIKRDVGLFISNKNDIKLNNIISFFEISEEYDRGIISNAKEFSINKKIRKVVFKGLNPREYEHPFDTDSIEMVKQLDWISNIVLQPTFELIMRIQEIDLIGGSILVDNENYKEVYDVFLECCNILDIKNIPELYIKQGALNAATNGLDKKFYVVISSSIIGLFNREELMFIIGHELGHIKSGHCYYNFIASNFSKLVNNLPVLDNISKVSLLRWSRMSEFTADRSGLLCCQNVNSAITAFMKIAGVPIKYYSELNTDSFLKQAEEFKVRYKDDLFGNIAKAINIVNSTHPWTLLRSYYINEWSNSEDYYRLLSYYSSIDKGYTLMKK